MTSSADNDNDDMIQEMRAQAKLRLKTTLDKGTPFTSDEKLIFGMSLALELLESLFERVAEENERLRKTIEEAGQLVGEVIYLPHVERRQ